MKRLSIALALALVMLIGAALGGMLDLGGASGPLSRIASHLLKRELRIDGDLELRLGLKPRLAARDIVLANPSWARGDLLRIAQLELELDLMSLWRRPLRIEYLRAAGARLDLLEREDGSSNWTFSQAADAADKTRGLQLQTLIIDGQVTDSLVRYLGPDLDSPAELHIDQLASYLDTSNMLQLELQGNIGELPVRADGEAGDYGAMLSGKDLSFDLNLALGRYRLTVGAVMRDLARLEGFKLQGRLTGPDSKALYDALNFSQSDQGPVDLNATINDLPSGLSGSLLGQFGSLTMDIDGALRDPLELDGLQSTLAIAGNNLNLVARWLGVHSLPAESFKFEGRINREGQQLQLHDVELKLGEARLQANATAPYFPEMRDLQLNASLDGPSFAPFREMLGLQGEVDVPFELDMAINAQPDALAILDSSLQMEGSRLTVSGPLGDQPGFVGSELRLEFEGDNLADLLAEVGVKDGPALPFQGDGLVRTTSPNKLQITESRLALSGLLIQLSGEVNDLATLDDNELWISMNTPSLGNSMRQFGQRGLPQLPASLDARLHGPLATPTIDGLEIQLGDARLDVEGAIQGFPTLSIVEAKLRGEVPGPVDWLPAPLQRRLVISSNLRASGRQIWLEDLSVTSPQWQMKGLLEVIDLERRLGSLRLSMQGARLASLLPSFARFQPATIPFELSADLQRTAHGLDVNLLRLQAAGNRLDLRGALSGRDDAAVTLSLQGDSLASLGELDGAVLPDQTYALQGRLKQAGKLWSLDDLDIRLGGGEMTGSLQVHQRERPRLVAKLQSKRFNFGQFLPPANRREKSDLAAQQPAGTLLIPDRKLPLAWLDSFDAELHLNLAGLDIQDRRFPELIMLDSLRLDASLKAGQLTLSQLQLAGDRGTLNAPGVLHWQAGMLELDSELRSEQFKLSLISPSYNIASMPTQRIRSRFKARGNSLHQLAASLSGYLLIESGPGKIVNVEMGEVFDAFTNQLLETINPFFKQDEYTELLCSVVGIQFKHGKAVLDPGAIFRSSKIDIIGTGIAELATEEIYLDIASKNQEGMGFSAGSLVTPYVQVGGTLANPELIIDKSGVAVTAGIAAATGGLSIVADALWDRYMNDSDPCEQASRQAQAWLDEFSARQMNNPAKP